MPTGQETAPSVEVNSTPATPQMAAQQSRIGWLWNSARKYIPGLRGDETEPATTTQIAPDRSASPSPSDRMPPPGSPDIFAQPLQPPPPRPEPDSVQETLRRLKAMPATQPVDWYKRNKKWDFAAKAIERDERAAKFNTKQVPGSNKRKITDEPEEPEQPSTPPRNSFQPPSVEDDDDDDDDDEVTATPADAEVLLKTPEKQPQIAPTLLKSALRTGTKSKLNVGFDESTIKSIPETRWKDCGPAGHYTGTTFLDPMDPKNKKHFQRLAEAGSPELATNKDPKFTQPNTFGILDEDIEYGDLSEEDIVGEAITQPAGLDATPVAPPSAPRPSHAELPPSPKQSERVLPGESPPGGQLFKRSEAGQKALEEQRARANKYKPKNSSGLSHVEPARSRSTSPPRSDFSAIVTTTATAPADDVPALSDDNGDASDEAVSPTPPSRPLTGNIGAAITPIELDNTTKGDDGMTDYEREHQFDAWAAGLDWPELQTYVEAGVCSAYMDDLLRKKWTKEDERMTQEWWEREFDDVDRAMEEAKRHGQRLELVWGDQIENIE